VTYTRAIGERALTGRSGFNHDSEARTLTKAEGMGLTLEFYVGDPEAIGPAVAEADFDTLYQSGIVKMRADFSLHIQPKDLDTLSVEIAGLQKQPPVLLQESLGDAIGGDESDHGAFLVASEWVLQVGSLQPSSAPEITKRWITSVARIYDDPEIRVTPEAEEAVSALISLCRHATGTSTPVIHAWFL
jgi:hypothetical protein